MNHFDVTRAQRKAWSVLARSHSSRRVASTYLFYGREGVGSWALAIEFAALLNCQNPLVDSEDEAVCYPCGDCQPCRSIRALNYEGLQFVVPIATHKNSGEAIDLTNEVLDIKRNEPFAFHESSKQTQIPIARAREIKKSLATKAIPGMTRIVLFYQMEKMRASSADALLKLIEEPPPNTVIILTSKRPEGLLPTIQSRAQKIRLERLPEAAVVDYLQSRYEMSEDRAKLVCRISDGVLGKALRLDASNDSDDAERRAGGLALFSALFHESGPDMVAQMNELINYRNRAEVEELLRLWQALIRDCARYAITSEEDDLINIDFGNEIRQMAGAFSSTGLAGRMVSHIKNTLADFPRNVHIQPALVALALKLKTEISSAGATSGGY